MEQNKIQLAIQQRQKDDLPIINLSFADYTFYTSLLQEKKIQSSFVNIFKYPYYYPTAKGEFEARQAVSKYYKKFGQIIDPENILLTSSINQSYLYLLKIFGSEESEILTPQPSPPSLEEVASFLDLAIQSFSLEENNGWQIDLKSLEAKLTSKTRAIFLMSPHLPTGSIQSAETLTALFKLIKGKNIAVIIDESLSDFIFNKKEFPIIQSLAEPEQLIISLQTLSNTFALPGLKLSWLTLHGDKTITEPLAQAIEYLADTFLTINQLSQTILPEIIKFSNKWTLKFQKQVEKNRDITASKLSKSSRLKFHYPEGGFYCLVQVLDEFKIDEDFVVDLLNKTGVYVHPGQYYGQKQGCYFMICFLQDPRILRNSLKKIVSFLKTK